MTIEASVPQDYPLAGVDSRLSLMLDLVKTVIGKSLSLITPQANTDESHHVDREVICGSHCMRIFMIRLLM